MPISPVVTIMSAAVMLMLSATAAAQASADVDPFSIRVTGDATVVPTPDQADIDVAGERSMFTLELARLVVLLTLVLLLLRL